MISAAPYEPTRSIFTLVAPSQHLPERTGGWLESNLHRGEMCVCVLFTSFDADASHQYYIYIYTRGFQQQPLLEWCLQTEPIVLLRTLDYK